MSDWRKGMLLRDCVGKRFRLTCGLSSGVMTLPAGFGVTISRAYRWQEITIVADPCPHCGVRPHMRAVPWTALEPETTITQGIH